MSLSERLTSRRSPLARAVVLLWIAGAALLSIVPAAAHAVPLAAADEGVTISVPVLEGAKPTGSGSGTPATPTVPTTPIAVGTAATITQTPVGSAAADSALGADVFNLAGTLYVSGLSGAVSGSAGPGGGDVTLSITVKNASSETLDATSKFWLDNAFGLPVAEVSGVAIRALKPGETRTIDVTMQGPGQWALYDGHATITPPKAVSGTQLEPITRDTTVWLTPWFAVLVVGIPGTLVAGWYLFGQRLRFAEAPVAVATA